VKNLLLSLISVLTCVCSNAQRDSISSRRIAGGWAFEAGAGYSKHLFADVGIAYARDGTVGHHPLEDAIYLATEIYAGNKLVMAPKIGAWAAGGAAAMGLGVNLLYYTDFSGGRVVFRPEVGIGVQGSKLYYGKNIPIGNSQFEGFSRNVVGFTIWINKKLR
jgi:hypothetical protein